MMEYNNENECFANIHNNIGECLNVKQEKRHENIQAMIPFIESIKKKAKVLTLAAHILKLERYRED